VDGPQNPIVFYAFSTPSVATYYEHTYLQGERLDQLAAKYYNNPNYWWIIPEFNPQIIDFVNITPGTVIRIPRV
jgi:nucleoid-associated protein YgaU